MNLSQLLTQMRTAPELIERITAWKVTPPREGSFADFPPTVDSRLVDVLKSRGIERLFTHQALAIEAAQRGEDFIVVTPTASGKTLCYNIPVLNSLLEDPHSRAIYLFPTKALSQDQLDELHGLITALDVDIKTYTYDGDTPVNARKAIRAAGHIVITNPDMLHTGILPHHTKWVKLFENLKYVVIDEVHQYRGVFGSHLANVIRRLKRDPERLAFKAALSRVCITFTEHHPEWAAPFFNEQFLAHRAAPLLARCLTRHAPPDGAELAAIWADQMELQGEAREERIAELTRVAADFLGWLETELRAQPGLQPFFVSQDLESIAEAAARTVRSLEAIRAELTQALEGKRLAPSTWECRGEYLKAAYGYVERGQLDKAGANFRRAGEYKKAGKCFKGVRDWKRAAKMYERAKAWSKAGEAYQETSRFGKAAEMYERVGLWREAAEMYEQDVIRPTVRWVGRHNSIVNGVE